VVTPQLSSGPLARNCKQSMLKTAIIILLLASVTMFSCRRSRQQSNKSANLSRQAIESQQAIDTAAVLSTLRFCKEDSAFIHNPDSTSRIFDDTTVLYSRVSISPRLPLFDIRAVLSVRRHHKVSHFGSYALIYKGVPDTSSVHRIHRDSIDIIVPALSSMEPALSFVDFNHDGYKDIHVSFTQNTAGNTGYNCFLKYDSALQQFEPDPVLDSLFFDQEIFIDERENKIIEGGRMGVESYGLSEYSWNGTTYILSADESSGRSEDGSALITTRKELRDGHWIVVSSDTTFER
jgi:hypothetical protein